MMFFISLVASLVVSLPLARAEIIEAKSLSELARYVDGHDDDKTAVIFDIDNTILESAHSVGGDSWFSRLAADYKAAGHDERTAKDLAVNRWAKVQPFIDVRPVEPQTAQVIAALQKSNRRVFALTARPEFVTGDTLRQLSDVGVRFSTRQGEPSDLCFTIEVRSCYRDGILFVNNSNKGDALVRLAQELGWDLERIIFVDDKAHNVETVNEALNRFNTSAASKIEHIELRYGAADARVAEYDHRIAAVQEYYLSRILPESVARQMVEEMNGTQEY